MSWNQEIFEFPLQLRYQLTTKVKKPGLVILLHGYQDHGLSMFRRLGWDQPATPLPFQVLFLNAPFPVPIWTSSGFKEAYSWYFRDTSRDLTLVPPELSCDRIRQLIEKLNLHDEPKAIVGFSQGGYLAPYLTSALKNVRAIIGLGTGYTAAPYANLKSIEVHAIHGAKDSVIDLVRAQKDHAELMRNGIKGSYHIEPDLDHRVDPVLDRRVRELCCQAILAERPDLNSRIKAHEH